MQLTDEEFCKYVDSLKPGERVVETGISGMTGCTGSVYISENPGPSYGWKCVSWDPQPGETGRMGTSVTHGTRRISDVPHFECRKAWRNKNRGGDDVVDVQAIDGGYSYVAWDGEHHSIYLVNREGYHSNTNYDLRCCDYRDYYESRKQQHVFWCPKGTTLEEYVTEQDGWHFWDEVGIHGGGPYTTEIKAIERFEDYCENLKMPSTPSTQEKREYDERQ